MVKKPAPVTFAFLWPVLLRVFHSGVVVELFCDENTLRETQWDTGC